MTSSSETPIIKKEYVYNYTYIDKHGNQKQKTVKQVYVPKKLNKIVSQTKESTLTTLQQQIKAWKEIIESSTKGNAKLIYSEADIEIIEFLIDMYNIYIETKDSKDSSKKH